VLTRPAKPIHQSKIHTKSKHEARSIYSLVQTNGRADGVDEDVVVVATSLVGTETSELVLKNELALVVERSSVVVANIDLALGIVKNRLFKLVLYPCNFRYMTYCLTTVVPSRSNTRGRVSLGIEEVSLLDQAPERIGASGRVGVTASIDERIVVPAASLEAIGRVLGGVQLELVALALAKGGGAVDLEAVAVVGSAEDELGGGHAGGGPLGDGVLGGALVVAGIARAVERGVGAGDGGPGAVVVVVLEVLV
jgi:hypothetical protein